MKFLIFKNNEPILKYHSERKKAKDELEIYFLFSG